VPLHLYQPPRWFVLVAVSTILLHIVWLIADGFRPPVLPADVVIVLGSKVHPDGKPSSGLQRRLERAQQLFRLGAVQAIIVSGGRGVEGFQEADVMRRVLMQAGVPADKIITDRTGNNTRLTAIHGASIMHSHSWHSAVVVSQYYHVPRAKMAFRQEGIRQVSGAAAEYRFAWTDPISILRECAGLYAYAFY
jgi:vancomycin permeability regulator SanA